MTELNAHDDEHNSQLKKWFDKKKIIVLGLLIDTLAAVGAAYWWFFEYNRVSTGAAFSLLPPENATGNWIKVVQRVPVKILLDKPAPPDRTLWVGLSLTVSINTADRSSPALRPQNPTRLNRKKITSKESWLRGLGFRCGPLPGRTGSGQDHTRYRWRRATAHFPSHSADKRQLSFLFHWQK